MQENGDAVWFQLFHQGGNHGGLTAMPSMWPFSAAASPEVRSLIWLAGNQLGGGRQWCYLSVLVTQCTEHQFPGAQHFSGHRGSVSPAPPCVRVAGRSQHTCPLLTSQHWSHTSPCCCLTYFRLIHELSFRDNVCIWCVLFPAHKREG